MIESILKAVLGPDGSFCVRWREIDIRFAKQTSFRIPFFSYPTPQLTSLTLHRVLYRLDGALFLPSVPTLRHIDVASCGLPHLPDTRGAIHIRFEGYYNEIFGQQLDSTTPQGLVDAEKVRYLELEIGGLLRQNYALPTNLLSLERLSLVGNTMPDNIATIQSPVLRELRIKFDEHYDTEYGEDDHKFPIRVLLKCSGLHFHLLETLTIEFDKTRPLKMTDANWEAYYRLLRICNNVKKISGDDASTVFVLRLLKDDCIVAGALSNRALIISNGEKNKEVRIGKEQRLEDIEQFADELGWTEMEEDRRLFLEKLYRRYR